MGFGVEIAISVFEVNHYFALRGSVAGDGLHLRPQAKEVNDR